MVTFREMTPQDIPVLAAWIAEIPLWQRYGITPEKMELSLETAHAAGDLLLVADREDHAVGLAWVMLKGMFGRSPYLRLLGVQHAQQGLGAALLTEAENRLTAHELFLLVSDFNLSAQKFYQRQGYTYIGALPGYVLADVSELVFWKKLHS